MNDKKLYQIFKILYPPFLYIFIMMTVEVFAIIIMTNIHTNELKKFQNVSAEQSYDYVTEIENLIEKNAYLISLFSALLAIIIFGWIYKKNVKEGKLQSILGQFFYVKDHIRENKKKLINLSIFVVSFNLGVSRFLSLLPLDNVVGSYEKTQKALFSGNIFIQILSIAIIVPIAEELIYRGLVLNRMKELTGNDIAIVLTAMIFGIFHFNLMQGIYAFLFGILLGFIAIKYNSLIYAILMHVIANFTAVVTNAIGLSGLLSKNIIIYAIIMSMEIGISIYCYRKI